MVEIGRVRLLTVYEMTDSDVGVSKNHPFVVTVTAVPSVSSFPKTEANIIDKAINDIPDITPSPIREQSFDILWVTCQSRHTLAISRNHPTSHASPASFK